MATTSSIEWTEVTWNPTVGCTKVSEGCRHCYAMRMAHRLGHNPRLGDEYTGLTRPSSSGPQWTRTVRALPARLEQPLRWRRPRQIFVNSMSDLFHEDVAPSFIGAVFAVMAVARDHTFQVLTKRPERMREWCEAVGTAQPSIAAVLLDALDVHAPHLAARLEGGLDDVPWPLPNVWLGTSVEHESVAGRIDALRGVPAAVRFLSLEPLLGPLPHLDLSGIGWVIAGGESGPGARPMQREWVIDIRDRCARMQVPFFFKQWGGVRKRDTGRELDGRTWDEMPRGEPQSGLIQLLQSSG